MVTSLFLGIVTTFPNFKPTRYHAHGQQCVSGNGTSLSALRNMGVAMIVAIHVAALNVSIF